MVLELLPPWFALEFELFALLWLLFMVPPTFELFALLAFEFMFEPMFELFALLAFEFMTAFELFAFPLALPFALSAGVQAVQTLATARRVRSASVLRIEFPPVPLRGQIVGELRGPSHAFTLQLIGLVLRRRLARPFGSNRTFRGKGSAPQRVTWARLREAHRLPVFQGPRKNLRRAI